MTAFGKEIKTIKGVTKICNKTHNSYVIDRENI